MDIANLVTQAIDAIDIANLWEQISLYDVLLDLVFCLYLGCFNTR